MIKLCSVAGNDDIEPHIPMLVDCMAHPDAVPACVQKLGSTTFVQDMSGPALAVMIPLLVRALNERSTSVLRPTSIIIDNLCKLVKNPADAGQFLPQLLPGLDKIIETAAIPEVRTLASTAKQTLEKVGGAVTSHLHEDQEKAVLLYESDITAFIESFLSKEIFIDPFTKVSVDYTAKVLAQLVFANDFNEQEWQSRVKTYLSTFLLPTASLTLLYKPIYEKYNDEYQVRKMSNLNTMQKRFASENQIDSEEGEELCNCEFSLAYGARMLLNRTRLRLVRGQRYGLCGANGAGTCNFIKEC